MYLFSIGSSYTSPITTPLDFLVPGVYVIFILTLAFYFSRFSLGGAEDFFSEVESYLAGPMTLILIAVLFKIPAFRRVNRLGEGTGSGKTIRLNKSQSVRLMR